MTSFHPAPKAGTLVFIVSEHFKSSPSVPISILIPQLLIFSSLFFGSQFVWLQTQKNQVKMVKTTTAAEVSWQENNYQITVAIFVKFCQLFNNNQPML